MKILRICGSTRQGGSNALLLSAFAKTCPEHTWLAAPSLSGLPLFTTERLAAGRPEVCEVLAKAVRQADGIVIVTPEYAHNMPAALKNAFEWLVASGEFSRKRTVAITSTPQAPRGEKCMQSLLWTLNALDADVLLEMPLYNVGTKIDAKGKVLDDELKEYLTAAIEVLAG